MLQYSRDLEKMASDPDLPKGLGKVTIYGGRLEIDNKQRELRDVFRCACGRAAHTTVANLTSR